MHLGIYHFDGDPDELHLCVRRSDGITIYDTCPSREVFESFSASATFRGAHAAAGLPAPAVEGQAVHEARVRGQRI